jgi:hypothetical protein
VLPGDPEQRVLVAGDDGGDALVMLVVACFDAYCCRHLPALLLAPVRLPSQAPCRLCLIEQIEDNRSPPGRSII